MEASGGGDILNYQKNNETTTRISAMKMRFKGTRGYKDRAKVLSGKPEAGLVTRMPQHDTEKDLSQQKRSKAESENWCGVSRR